MSIRSNRASRGTRLASLGTISEGTTAPEALIPAFAEELESLARDARRLRQHRQLIKEANTVDPSSDDAAETLQELSEALETFAPPYCYFGAHPGDGADFGFWLSESFQHEFAETDGLQVDDLSDVPTRYSGEVLHVNDHGNATLYAYSRGRGREIWSVV
jgi:hypothetical protein